MLQQCTGQRGEHSPSNCVINGMGSESQGCGLVVCLSVRKIHEKLKSPRPLSPLFVVSWEGAGETASSTRDQGRAWSTENEAGTRGISDSTGQDSSQDARQCWHDEGRPDSFAPVVKDRNASRRRQASTSTSGRIVLKLWICGWSFTC